MNGFRCFLPSSHRQDNCCSSCHDISAGIDFPSDLKSYSLILHCGGCMFTRKQLMSRLIRAEAENVPITNYGVAIAYLNGILERVTEIFPEMHR